MSEREIKLLMMIDACQASGFSLDLLEWLTRGLDAHALAICCGNVSALPKYRKSNETP